MALRTDEITCIIINRMQPININTLLWVDTPEQFNAMVLDLENQAAIGIDTESDSLYVYYEKVCLLQISTLECDYLVDPLSIDSLDKLNKIFKSEKIEKVFHAAEYDILCLKRDFHFQFNNLFDTMIASRILGKKQIGLSNLLAEYFDVTVNKKYQRANWGKRPINEEMLNYASMDSHYLIELSKIIKNELAIQGLTELAEEDFLRTSKIQPPSPARNEDLCWRYLKGNGFAPSQVTVFVELFNFREEIAKRNNIPPFKVISTDLLNELAYACPQTQRDLKEIPSMSPKLVARYGNEILKVVKLAFNKKHVSRPHKQRPNEDFVSRYETLKKWRKNTASHAKIESDVVLPKEFMEVIAYKNPNSMAEIKQIMADVPYRYEKYGQEIFSLFNR